MNDTRKKLAELEAIYGSQVKAAKKLGVSVAQYRKYKTGKASIPEGKAKKTKDLYRANHRIRKSPEYEKKVEKKRLTAEKKRAKRFPGGAKTDSLMNWMRRKEFPHHIQVNLPESVREPSGAIKYAHVHDFVAFPAFGNDDHVQFVDADDIALARFGKQESTRSLILIGLVINLRTTNGKGGFIERDPDDVERIKEEMSLDEMEVFKTRGTILTRRRESWTLAETLDYAAHIFMESQSFGRNLEPTLFLGFQL